MKLDRNPQAVLEALRRAHEIRPDLRTGKVIANAVYKRLGAFSSSLFHLEDSELAAAILAYVGEDK